MGGRGRERPDHSDPDHRSGAPIPDETFIIGLANANPAGAIGSPATSIVTIRGEAGLTFDANPYSATEGNLATVTVHRLVNATGAVSVHYTTGNGTAAAGSDYTAVSGTLNWADGDMQDKSFTIPIVDDGVSEGRETINLTLNSPTSGALIEKGAATVNIAPSDGTTIFGVARDPRSSFTDSDGDQVTIKLGGKIGALTYYLTNGTGPIPEIDLAGTVAQPDDRDHHGTRNRKAPTVQGGADRRGRRRRVQGFYAKVSDLTGTGFNLTGFAGSIAVANVTNGADFELLGPAPSSKAATRITSGVIGDGTDINIVSPLGSLTAIAVGRGTSSAERRLITVKGQRASRIKPFVSGDFNSDLMIAGRGQASAKCGPSSP